MSYVSHRPSILHRPQRSQASRANEESLEAQYQREQAILRAKQEKQQDTHQRILRSLYPQPEDKAAAWEALVASNSLLANRQAKPEREAQAAAWQPIGSVYEVTRPWHHSMATQQVSPAEEEAARRRFAAEVAAENQRMAREKEMMRAMEEQARRQPVQDTWYQKGDTHRAPEALHYGFGAPTTDSAPSSVGPSQRQSGYPWGAADATAQVTRPQTAQPPSALAPKQYPWSWQT